MTLRVDSKRLAMKFVLLSRQWLRQNICVLLLRWYVFQGEIFLGILLLDVMISYVDMLHSFVKDWILYQTYGTLIIIHKECRRNILPVKQLLDESLHPSFAVWQAAMYSASVVDNATDCCLCEFHDIVPEASFKTYTVVDRRI